MELARYAEIIEKHYQRPMDIEWGKDGLDGKALHPAQARPETVKSQSGAGPSRSSTGQFSKVLTHGRAIGQKIGIGPVRIVHDPRKWTRSSGDVLVADMTDPNWEPVMKRAAAIVTNRGGAPPRRHHRPRTGHSGHRRLRRRHRDLTDGDTDTVSAPKAIPATPIAAASISGHHPRHLGNMPDVPVKVMMNVGNRNWPSSSPSCRTPASVWPASSSSSTTSSASTRRPSSTSTGPPAGLQARGDQRRARGYASPKSSSSESWRKASPPSPAAFLAAAGDRPPFRLQVQRVQEAAGRRPLRAGRRNPMLRLPWRLRYIAQSFRDCFELRNAGP